MLFNFIQISIDIKVTLDTVGYNLCFVLDFTIITIESDKCFAKFDSQPEKWLSQMKIT